MELGAGPRVGQPRSKERSPLIELHRNLTATCRMREAAARPPITANLSGYM